MELWHVIEFDGMECGTFWTSSLILEELIAWFGYVVILIFFLLDLWLNLIFRYMRVDNRLFELSTLELIKQVRKGHNQT